jgi:DNA-binding PadR family transcriptional regulator
LKTTFYPGEKGEMTISTKKIQEQLTKNLLFPIVLDLLDDHAICGYELMSIIKKTYGVTLGPSTIYPTLSHLESKKLITSEWNMDNLRPKKIYKLTHEGQDVLNYSAGALNQICRRLENFGAKNDKNIQIAVIL